jgi:hypothetical protein
MMFFFEISKSARKSCCFVSHQACEADALASAKPTPTERDALASLDSGKTPSTAG